jgi:hypothetical protein
VVTGYTCVEDSLLGHTRTFLGLDFGVVKPGKRKFKCCPVKSKTLKGIEAMNMVKKDKSIIYSKNDVNFI